MMPNMQVSKTIRPVALLVSLLAVLSACAGPKAAPSAPANSTGVPELDVIITAALKNDPAALIGLVEFTQAECTKAEGLGGPPKCLAGEPEGTPVEVLPFLGPEGHFVRKQDIGEWRGIRVSALYAAYLVSDAAYSDPDYPAGEYALVFTGEAGSSGGITLQVRDGRIVRIDEAPGTPPQIRSKDVASYLVMPSLGSP